MQSTCASAAAWLLPVCRVWLFARARTAAGIAVALVPLLSARNPEILITSADSADLWVQARDSSRAGDIQTRPWSRGPFKRATRSRPSSPTCNR